ncbi:MAG: alpha/beta hydrolase family protein [Actinomycetes bacterium]
MTETFDVDTPFGTGRVDLHVATRSVGLLVLGHGAGGTVDTADLVAVRDAALAEHLSVALVTQPYRVAGRRSPAPARQLDGAWVAVVEELRARRRLARLPVVAGGRSSGARVACRTASALGVAGVLALAFPLHPPGRPERSRAEELEGAGVPCLVLQGERDSFGKPDELPAGVPVRPVAGADHGFARATDLAEAAVEAAVWARARATG